MDNPCLDCLKCIPVRVKHALLSSTVQVFCFTYTVTPFLGADDAQECLSMQLFQEKTSLEIS